MIRIRCQELVIVNFTLAALSCLVGGCRRSETADNDNPTVVVTAAPEESSSTPEPCNLILAPHEGTRRLDVEITRLQAKLRNEPNSLPYSEKLGWLFVAKSGEGRTATAPGWSSG